MSPYAQTNLKQPLCIKARNNLAAPVIPCFPSELFQALYAKNHHFNNARTNTSITNNCSLKLKHPPAFAIIKRSAGINTGNELAFNFPSHNAALQCFDISHKTQLAFQIRALTFSSKQADLYLHNLDGLSLLCCPWPFVSNVHTDATESLRAIKADEKHRYWDCWHREVWVNIAGYLPVSVVRCVSWSPWHVYSLVLMALISLQEPRMWDQCFFSPAMTVMAFCMCLFDKQRSTWFASFHPQNYNSKPTLFLVHLFLRRSSASFVAANAEMCLE